MSFEIDKNLKVFFIKCAIVAVLAALAGSYVLNNVIQRAGEGFVSGLVFGLRAAYQSTGPVVKTKINEKFGENELRIRFNSLLTRNPAAHWLIADDLEGRGDIEGAVEEVQLGLGLVEVSGGDLKLRKKFEQRLAVLREKLETK